ncbi:hypothetical protein [Jannaschia formosa]|uniref:hypothetical protein n=1 Tax=Jannaschia formosa TaxID=2259592 RepID=UPI000E1BF86C|nr:hypothetical protein [Jannaschia formosa]TFL19345.1 hypothetical protein DR046_05315 [Jannaschia formosa]
MVLRLVTGGDAGEAEQDRAEALVARLKTLGQAPSGGHGGAVGLPPGPALGSKAMTTEIGTLWGAALLRDVHFADWAGHPAAVAVSQAVASLPSRPGPRAIPDRGEIPFADATLGAGQGPYVSQFLLVGTGARPAARGWADGGSVGTGGAQDDGPGAGIVRYGAQCLHQRITGYLARLDHGTDWTGRRAAAGAILGPAAFECHPRFVATPRDLASFVDLGAPHQAFLTALHLILDAGTPLDGGLSLAGDAVGPADIEALVLGAAARAVDVLPRLPDDGRATPSELAAGLALARAGDQGRRLGERREAFAAMAAALEPSGLPERIAAHNAYQNRLWSPRDGRGDLGPLAPEDNVLLPLATTRDAPDRGTRLAHAAAAGACATVLKACFEMFEPDPVTGRPRARPLTGAGAMLPCAYEADPDDPTHLRPVAGAALSLQGEIDKLAANLAAARCFAGQAAPSETRAALRLGERLAVAMLRDRLGGAPAAMRFTSFDGDHLTIAATPGTEGARVLVRDAAGHGGSAETLQAWWTRQD